MTTARVGALAEFVRRASELVPVLRRNATWAEQNGRLHEETLEAMAAAGVFRARVPARLGGYGSAAQTLVEVGVELGRGDGAAAWAAAAWWMAGWAVGLFPEQVQEEVFSTPEARVCGTLSPDGTAAQRPDGVLLTGRWRSVAGARHSQWQQVVAISAGLDGTPEPIMALVPVGQLQVVPDAQATLPGSGTASTLAAEVFVPAERVVRLGAVLRDRRRPARGAPVSYRTPLPAVAATASVGALIGLAKAAQDDAFERLLAGRAGFLGRSPGPSGAGGSPGLASVPTAGAPSGGPAGGPSGGPASGAEPGRRARPAAPPDRPRLAGASAMTDQAEARAHRIASLVDAKEVSRTPWTVEERDRARADFASACRLAIQATDLAAGAVPPPVGHDPEIARQIARAIRAVHRHALVDRGAGLDLIGRLLSRQEPGTFSP